MNRRRTGGFTITELVVITCVLLFTAFLVLQKLSSTKPSSKRIRCVSHLKNVGLGFRIYATDNNDRFPGWSMLSNHLDLSSIRITDIYNALSNELSTPKILLCDYDKKRVATDSFAQLKPENISYFASLSADESNPQSFLAGDRNILVDGKPVPRVLALTTNSDVAWSREIHVEQGNIVMGDGSVQQFSISRLKTANRQQGMATNFLVFP